MHTNFCSTRLGCVFRVGNLAFIIFFPIICGILVHFSTDFGPNRGGQVSLQPGRGQGLNGNVRPVEVPQNVQHVDPHLPPEYEEDTYPENTTIL